jgi:hypothetical protein
MIKHNSIHTGYRLDIEGLVPVAILLYIQDRVNSIQTGCRGMGFRNREQVIPGGWGSLVGATLGIELGSQVRPQKSSKTGSMFDREHENWVTCFAYTINHNCRNTVLFAILVLDWVLFSNYCLLGWALCSHSVGEGRNSALPKATLWEHSAHPNMQ